MDFGSISNLVVCVLIFLLSVGYEVLLHRKVQRRSDATRARVRFQLLALRFWVLAWGSWILLYLLRVFSPRWLPTEGVIDLALSDVNSLFLFACFFVVSRGNQVVEDHPGPTIGTAIIFLLVILAAGDACLYLLGEAVFTSRSATVFWRLTSVALSMTAPFMLGRAFLKRYGSRSICAYTIAYAMLQPLMYGIEFFPPVHHNPALCLPKEIVAEPTRYGIEPRWLARNGGFIRELAPTEPSPIEGAIPEDCAVFAIERTEKVDDDTAAALLKAARPPGYWKGWLQLKLATVLLGFLALLKVALCGEVLRLLQRVAPFGDNTVLDPRTAALSLATADTTTEADGEGYELEDENLDTDGRKYVQWSLVVLGLVILVLSVSYHSDVQVVVVWTALVSGLVILKRLTGWTIGDFFGGSARSSDPSGTSRASRSEAGADPRHPDDAGAT